MRSIFFYLFSLSIICCYSCQQQVKEQLIPNVIGGELVVLENFKSEFIKSRPIHIWLPPSYQSGEKLGVLYMHDGQMLFDAQTTWNKQEWGVDEYFSEHPEFQKFIVVGVFNGSEDRRKEYFPLNIKSYLNEVELDQIKELGYDTILNQINSDDYLSFLVKELKPYVDSLFNVYTDKNHTAIMGSSMGGLISWYAALEYPNIFGSVACMSTHWPGAFTNENNPFPSAFLKYLEDRIDPLQGTRYYFDTGTKTLDSLYLVHQNRVDSLFLNKGFDSTNFQSLIFDGAAHRELDWSNRLEFPIVFLLKK